MDSRTPACNLRSPTSKPQVSTALRRWLVADLEAARDRLAGGVLSAIPPDRMAETVDGGGVPPVYALWHMTRHHDVAINGVLRGRGQVVQDFTDHIGVSDQLWRGLSEGADHDLVAVLQPEAVADYAIATINATIAWIREDAPLDTLETVPDSPAVLTAMGTPEDDFDWLYDMWSGKPNQWFLSWEAHGHTVTHTGELVSLRNRMGLSPF